MREKPKRYYVAYADREKRQQEFERVGEENAEPGRYWAERDFTKLSDARRFLRSDEASVEGAHLYERRNIEWEFGWNYDSVLIEES